MHDSTRITRRLGSVISAHPRYFSFNLQFLSIYQSSSTKLAMFLSSRRFSVATQPLNMHFFTEMCQDKHCYSRLLELLVNVWAYHSARRMVYIDPKTGFMQEQHLLKNRRGQMWIKWFQFSTLKAIDEDLAEESDTEHQKRRRLWPLTGEILWQGTFEKERSMRNREKEKRRQQSKDKIQRIRKRTHQKVIGKYVKPTVAAATATTNATDLALR